MIKSDMGMIVVNGAQPIVMAEFSTLAGTLMEEGGIKRSELIARIVSARERIIDKECDNKENAKLVKEAELLSLTTSCMKRLRDEFGATDDELNECVKMSGMSGKEVVDRAIKEIFGSAKNC